MNIEMGQTMIGSHNTMTYLPVKQWYFKPFFWTARCQSKTILEQYNSGARLFDMRIRFNKYNTPIFAHGPIEFKGSVADTLKLLNSSIQENKVYVRIILESNSPMKDQSSQEANFIDFCRNAQHSYENLIFFGGNRKYDWKVVYDFGIKEPSLDDKYSSTTNIFGKNKTHWSSKIDDLWPWLYAKIHNKRILKEGSNKDVLFIDFI